MAKRKLHANSLKNLVPPWKSGESGNPGGRPKKKPMSDRYAHMAEVVIEDPKLLKELHLAPGATYGDAAALSLFRQVIEGNHAAAKEVREAIEGKATVRVEHSGPDGGEIPIADGGPGASERLIDALKLIYGLGTITPSASPSPGPEQPPTKS